MKLSAFAAMAKNRVIGKNNDLPWSLPADLKRFKQMTSGHPVIMGRKTYESMMKPLPNRENIVITRQPGYIPPGAAPDQPHGKVHVMRTVEEAVAWCRQGDAEKRPGFEEAFVIGGAEIWKLSWHLLDRIYLTVIHREFEGDVFFPEFNWDDFTILFQEDHADPMPFTYYTLERKTAR